MIGKSVIALILMNTVAMAQLPGIDGTWGSAEGCQSLQTRTRIHETMVFLNKKSIEGYEWSCDFDNWEPSLTSSVFVQTTCWEEGDSWKDLAIVTKTNSGWIVAFTKRRLIEIPFEKQCRP